MAPLFKMSLRLATLVLCTLPLLAQAQTLPPAPVNPAGPVVNWVRSAATMSNIAQAEARFVREDAAGTRHFISPTPINYTDQDALHTPFANATREQDVWGISSEYFVATYGGYIIVPPAPANSATNTYTFAASTDDGFRFKIYDGQAIRTVEFDANRGMGTGPLIAVDFPVAGGAFPFDLISWEQGGAFGMALSWAPGNVTTFSTTTFSLIPHAQMFGPNLEALQTVRDLNGGVIAVGDTLELSVTLTNVGQAPAHDLVFEPRTLQNLTFGAVTQLPPGAAAGLTPGAVTLPVLDTGASVTWTYTVTVDAGVTHSAQGHITASTSPIATLGAGRIRALTDDPTREHSADTANSPVGLFPLTGAGDDDPTLTVLGADITAPELLITTPTDGATLAQSTPTVSGTSELGAQIEVSFIDDQGALIATATTVAGVGGAWIVNAPVLPEGVVTIIATATDAADNAAVDQVSVIIDTLEPAITITAPADGASIASDAPTITGTTEADTTVQVTLTDAQGMVAFTGAAMVTMAGDWSVDASALADGLYTVLAIATDPAGNTGSAMSTFNVDTQTFVTLDTPADGAQINTPAIVLTGTAEPGASVAVEVDGALVGTVTADASGDWTFTTAPLMDGPHTLAVTANDVAGNSASAGPRQVQVITQSTLTLTAPSDGAILMDNTPTISGLATPGAMVTALVDGMSVGTTTAAADGTWSITSTTLAEGDRVITATSVDGAGDTASAGPITVTIDAQTFVTLDAPADGSTVATATPTLSGTAEPGASIAVSVDGAVVGMVTAGADGTWSFTTEPLANGPHSLSVSATDASGNMASAGPHHIQINAMLVAVSITSPTQDQVFNTSVTDITGQAEAMAAVTVIVRDDQGAELAREDVTADANGAWSVSAPALGVGAYSVEASATDSLGNTSSAGPVDFFVSADDPNLSVTTPQPGLATANPTPSIAGQTDPDATISIEVRDAAGELIATLTPDVDLGDGTFSVDVDPALADGAYTVIVTATGPLGTTSEVTREITIDTVAPTVTITAPGATTTDTTPTITGTAEPGATVVITIDGEDVGTVIADENGAFTFTPTTPLAIGEHTIVVTATDAAGNPGDATTEVTIEDAPVAIAVTITSPTEGATIADSTPTITGSAAPGAMVEVQVDGALVGTVTADATGAWSLTLTEPLADGAHTVAVTATDDAGDTTQAQVTFSVDADEMSGEPLVITSPAPGAQITGPTITVSGTGTPGAMVTVTAGAASQTVTVAEDGSWSVSFDEAPAGELVITATDDQGGSATITITVVDGDEPAPVDPFDSSVLQGGGGFACQSAPLAPGAQPAGALLTLLGALGLMWRRRRQS